VYVLDGINNRIQVFGEDSDDDEDDGVVRKDGKCRFSEPDETTWVKFEPMEKDGMSGMFLTWTQYSADSINIKIDDGTGEYPWMISKTQNDGHEFLPNVFAWQNIKIQPINHCNKGDYSIPLSYSAYPYGWYNIK
jgi:hypothetical protein